MLEFYFLSARYFLFISIFFGGIFAQAGIYPGLYLPLLFDQIQYVVCEDVCGQEVLKAAGVVISQEFKNQDLQIDFQEGTLCRCSIAARPLSQLVGNAKERFVRQAAQGFAEVLRREDPKKPRPITDSLLDASLSAYQNLLSETGGSEAFINMQLGLINKMRSLRSLRGESTEFYRKLVKNSFVAGSFRNSGPYPTGCLVEGNFSCLTEDEIRAARRYMGQEYMAMNADFQSGNWQAGPYAIQNRRLISMLKKLKPVQTVTFRGIGPRGNFEKYQRGSPYSEAGFMSTSLNSRIAQRFMVSVSLILFTKSCPLISGAGGLFQGEDEVLCLPGTKFEVIHREDRGGSIYLFMEEI